MERKTFFADVIVPVSVPNLYTYRIPHELSGSVTEGQRVIIPFGKSKLYTGIIRRIHETPPSHYTAKYIETILDDHPVVHPVQLLFWEWVANYYIAHPGDVLNAALPSGLKLSSETKVVLFPEPATETLLTDSEFLVAEALRSKGELSMQEIAAVTGSKSNYALIRSMREKKVICLVEEIKDRFKAKTESRVRFRDEFRNENRLGELLNNLEKKAPKQVDLLLDMIRRSGISSAQEREVTRSELNDISALPALVKKGVLEVYEVEVGRFRPTRASDKEKTLSDKQCAAFEELSQSLLRQRVSLLHGVTSSGKTEIYTRFIRETLDAGKQVLYLIPEIAITTQLLERLLKYFGEAVGVYHSRFNENERVEIWNTVLHFTGKCAPGGPYAPFSMIIGARSSLFLPWKDLGLIIIDEEHDASFKQQDPSPRYHARDAAIFMASLFDAKVILGSATPSIESYRNASEGKYGLVSLEERHGGTALPHIHVVDLKKEWKEKTMKGHFSPQLLEGIRLAVSNGEQVILFQNRRGFAPVLECQWCGWRPVCTQCDVSMVYHKTSHQLRCHYCGATSAMPASCHACGDTHLKLKGFGTEQIEEELNLYLPGLCISRMDLDTTRSRQAHFQLVKDFEDGKIQVLVGTQMITKGLDFEHVSLVGIMDADGLLGFPDFRAHERAFQLMEQVAGRAGRRLQRGNVIIQSRNPDHPVIRCVTKHDYLSMFREELSQRIQLGFPPETRLIEILLLHRDLATLEGASAAFAEMLREPLGKRVLGPEFPIIPRVRNYYRKKILIRIETGASVSEIKNRVRKIILRFREDPAYRPVQVQTDVDPY
ncbi:MAG: primosomal protein N' [Bacteroidia bacterium]|nr:primosomal protein N' [Bacteroidia bacterium]